MNKQISKLTNNPIGALAGAAAGFFAAKKFLGGSNKFVLAGAVIAGAIGGAFISSSIKAKSGAPTAATAKK